MPATAFDAIIIGAGPAGSSAAILLARAGWKVALVERQTFPRRKVCGECIAATNLPLLESLGIGAAFHALAGPPLKQSAIFSGKHCLYADLPALAHASHPWGRALGREHLDSLLVQQANEEGAAIFQPWIAQVVSGQTGDWQCVLRHSSCAKKAILTAPILISAQGSWGKGASQSGTPRPSDLFAFKANFLDSKLPSGALPVLAFPGGYGGMVIGEEGITTIACCIRRDRLARCRNELPDKAAGEAVEAYLKASCDGVRQALEGAQRPSAWLAVGPIRPGIRLGHQRDGRFLIGNAAGEAHPIIGEGISMAIQSAWLLSGLFLGQRSNIGDAQVQHAIQREYRKRWQQHFARRVHLAAVFAHLAMRPRLASGLLPLLQRNPALLTWAAQLSGKVNSAPTPDMVGRAVGYAGVALPGTCNETACERNANDHA